VTSQHRGINLDHFSHHQIFARPLKNLFKNLIFLKKRRESEREIRILIFTNILNKGKLLIGKKVYYLIYSTHYGLVLFLKKDF
jgi:hypothetical protein